MRTISSSRDVAPGASAPLGATVLPGGVNFSVFSKHAVLLELLLFDDENATQPARIILLDADQHRTYHYWHAFVPGLQPCGSRAVDKHKDFAVSYVILCEKLRISFRMDPYRGMWVTCLDRSNGLTFVRNGNQHPFLQWRCATAVR